VGASISINLGHDSSITVIEDGKVVVHLQEERFNHLKHTNVPILCANELSKYINKIDDIRFHHLYPIAAEPTYILSYLKFVSGIDCNIPFFMDSTYHKDNMYKSHHDLHATGAFFHSGFNDATVIVIDGGGYTYDYGKENLSIYQASSNGLNILHRKIAGDNDTAVETNLKFIDTVPNVGAGMAYEAITRFIGFNGLDCGKTMGLSAYGKENKDVDPILTIDDHANKSCKPNWTNLGMNEANYQSKSYEFLSKSECKISKEDLAYRIQKDYEDYLIWICNEALSMNSSNNLVLSGGCALNCVANYKLLKSLPSNINLYVDPTCDDSGITIGGAISDVGGNGNFKLDTLYLGGQLQYHCELRDNEIEIDVNASDVAKLISEGNIVAIAQGRSEIGPRALGNRSILFDPRVKDGKDIVNRVKKREYFRPFAGTVLKEYARDWFDMDRLDESPYMMYAVDVLPAKKDQIPSIIHVDGTCRIQTVTSEQNKNYYDLISEFYKLTGVPILFNTSFNLAGDTMVETIDDAFKTIRNSEINYMYLPEIGKLIQTT
tara:strand:- start:455 stop:2098 length:1644 start_codon:yes stop_codon:yes gene_type:complete